MAYNITVQSKNDYSEVVFYVSAIFVDEYNDVIFGINEDKFEALEWADNTVDRMVKMVKADFKPCTYKVSKVKVKKGRY